MPKRIQRKRTKGWRKPEGVIDCTRSGKWGNPWTVGPDGDCATAEEAVRMFRSAVIGFHSNGSFCAPTAHPESYIGRIIADAPKELRGKDLMCWCALDQPCHADVLLELANK